MNSQVTHWYEIIINPGTLGWMLKLFLNLILPSFEGKSEDIPDFEGGCYDFTKFEGRTNMHS